MNLERKIQPWHSLKEDEKPWPSETQSKKAAVPGRNKFRPSPFPYA